MSKPQIGARVMYCGHEGYFIADIYLVGTANVVRPNGPVHPGNLYRYFEGWWIARVQPGETKEGPGSTTKLGPTHALLDFPQPGFWRPDIGVFVVPEEQVTVLGEEKSKKK